MGKKTQENNTAANEHAASMRGLSIRTVVVAK